MFKKKNQIWKLQRPLNPIGFTDLPIILAYTKGRENITQIPVDEATIGMIFGGADKIYVKGHVEAGMLKVAKQVADQDW